MNQRTRHITVVVEDLYQPHNASAVLRSCDCFGIQDVHIIENNNEYELNPRVSLGSSKWLTLHRYNDQNTNNTKACIRKLKSQGYKIAATTPHTDDVNINDLDVSDKVALIFGTESDGISQDAKDQADCFVKIPMHGFTESFNISVATAICLHELRAKLNSNIQWELSKSEKEQLMLEWLKQSIKHVDMIIEEFFANHKA